MIKVEFIDLGTSWDAPGNGATVVELWDQLEAFLSDNHRASEKTRAAFANLSWMIKKRGQEYRTNLALTGKPICDYDLERICICN